MLPASPSRRHCHHCGRRYLRRNLAVIWERHADGWHRITVKVCTNCLGRAQARAIYRAVHVTISARGTPRPLALRRRAS
jgi:hypothetical protein